MLLKKENLLLHELLDMGEALLMNGAEVNRVEDTLLRMGRACGGTRVNVFVITSDIVVTILFPGGAEMTQTRRISGSSNNFYRLEQLNALSRRFCAQPFPPEELHAELERIQSVPVSRWKIYLGSALAASSFAVFFGGTVAEGIAAIPVVLLIAWMQRRLAPLLDNTIIFDFAAAVVSGVALAGICRLLPGLRLSMMLIGDIMLLIPGIAMTNATRDMLVGDTISGLMRMIESLLWAVALAFGYLVAMGLLGGH